MQAKKLVELEEVAARSLLRSMRGPFVGNAGAAFFAGQPVSLLIPPSLEIPASVHCMYFPPGSTQPLHRHPGDRLLLGVTCSKITIEHTPDPSPLGATDLIVLPANAVVTLVIPRGTWHRFESDAIGEGSVLFSFHPHDDGDTEVLLASDLMERLTEFGPQ